MNSEVADTQVCTVTTSRILDPIPSARWHYTSLGGAPHALGCWTDFSLTKPMEAMASLGRLLNSNCFSLFIWKCLLVEIHGPIATAAFHYCFNLLLAGKLNLAEITVEEERQNDRGGGYLECRSSVFS